MSIAFHPQLQCSRRAPSQAARYSLCSSVSSFRSGTGAAIDGPSDFGSYSGRFGDLEAMIVAEVLNGFKRLACGIRRHNAATRILHNRRQVRDAWPKLKFSTHEKQCKTASFDSCPGEEGKTTRGANGESPVTRFMRANRFYSPQLSLRGRGTYPLSDSNFCFIV